jgi:hypothetical protein
MKQKEQNFDSENINLYSLGDSLVKCTLKCEGINNKPDSGIIPRCLFFEKRSGEKNSIIIGLNPGKCKTNEKEFYLKNGISYKSINEFFMSNLKKNRKYFNKTRQLISLLGFTGNIIWTDLAKCECIGENGSLPMQTYRTCINNFLRKEIELFPDYTIFTLGNFAFNFCSLSFPHHYILGLPHPTGSYYNAFENLIKSVKGKRSLYIDEIANSKDLNDNLKAIQITKLYTTK